MSYLQDEEDDATNLDQEQHEAQEQEAEDSSQEHTHDDVIRNLKDNPEEGNDSEMDVDQEGHLPSQTLHEVLGEHFNANLDSLILNATEIAGRHRERTSSVAYGEALLTLGIDDLHDAHPREMQKRLIKIVRNPKRSREEKELAGRLLDELNQEFEKIDIPRHKALEALAKIRDEHREEHHEVPDSLAERRRKYGGKVKGFSL